MSTITVHLTPIPTGTTTRATHLVLDALNAIAQDGDRNIDLFEAHGRSSPKDDYHAEVTIEFDKLNCHIGPAHTINWNNFFQQTEAYLNRNPAIDNVEIEL